MPQYLKPIIAQKQARIVFDLIFEKLKSKTLPLDKQKELYAELQFWKLILNEFKS